MMTFFQDRRCILYSCILLVALTALITPSLGKKKGHCCSFTLNNLAGESHHTDLSENKEYTWTITPNGIKKEAEIFLVFKEFLLHPTDNVTIYDSSNRVLFTPFSGFKEPFSLLTGAQRISIILKTGRDITLFKRSLWMYYTGKDRVISLTVDKGVILTPAYVPRAGKETITFKLKPLRVRQEKLSVMFHDFNIRNGEVEILNSENADGKYQASSPPPDIIASVTVTVKVTLDLQVPDQGIKMIMESVTAGCSEGISFDANKLRHEITVINPRDFTYPVSPSVGIECRWILYGPKDTIFNIHLSNMLASSPVDHLIINDGGQKMSQDVLQNVLLQAMLSEANSTRLKYVSTRENKAWISYRAFNIREKPNLIKLSITLTPSGRYTAANVIQSGRQSRTTAPKRGKREIFLRRQYDFSSPSRQHYPATQNIYTKQQQ